MLPQPIAEWRSLFGRRDAFVGGHPSNNNATSRIAGGAMRLVVDGRVSMAQSCRPGRPVRATVRGIDDDRRAAAAHGADRLEGGQPPGSFIATRAIT